MVKLFMGHLLCPFYAAKKNRWKLIIHIHWFFSDSVFVCENVMEEIERNLFIFGIFKSQVWNFLCRSASTRKNYKPECFSKEILMRIWKHFPLGCLLNGNLLVSYLPNGLEKWIGCIAQIHLFIKYGTTASWLHMAFESPFFQ